MQMTSDEDFGISLASVAGVNFESTIILNTNTYQPLQLYTIKKKLGNRASETLNEGLWYI